MCALLLLIIAILSAPSIGIFLLPGTLALFVAALTFWAAPRR
ncbi:MAG: hypothetical protein ACRDIY_01460 [Chloroflexota bacterium]